ncbi:hypothetical protein NDU88_003084 [Pleurodeles waltl]|uniref:Uncharacterized protein n=1 Tax=Pleurodeles waltl TaxID=8319 RepID=A0AAV7UCD0_PLEWA|nr:hypothetical protein NDU88_003084 [Pleurodeles waltl]
MKGVIQRLLQEMRKDILAIHTTFTKALTQSVKEVETRLDLVEKEVVQQDQELNKLAERVKVLDSHQHAFSDAFEDYENRS